MENIAIVSTETCSKLANTDKPFILALKKGENFVEAILHCARTVNLKSASVSGLGAVDDVTVAYYELPTKEYHSKLFEGTFELVSLNGNITMFEGKPFLHIHAALGKEDYSLFGGHIMSMTVGASAEITIIPLNGVINRQHDQDIGLKLMCCPIK